MISSIYARISQFLKYAEPEVYPWKKEAQQSETCQQEYFHYYKQETLDKLNPHVVAKDLNNKVLLCYEKSTDFCHRHIVAAWLRHYGYEAEEL